MFYSPYLISTGFICFDCNKKYIFGNNFSQYWYKKIYLLSLLDLMCLMFGLEETFVDLISDQVRIFTSILQFV